MSPFRLKIKKLISPRLQFRFVSLKHTFTKFKQNHYSQNGEDILLNSLFPENYKGFYIDVGAHHPYRISNTYLLFKRGWRGINIDANPESIKLFERARPKDKNIMAGVSEKEETLSYHMFSDPAVNTFSDKEADKWKNKNWIEYLGEKKIQALPLKTIFKENINRDQKIDVLSIDVEGFDLKVLESNDWNKFSPKVVIVEAHDFILENMHEHPLYLYLNKKEYKLVYVLKFSLIFLHKKTSLDY